jgi:hypothetical protein
MKKLPRLRKNCVNQRLRHAMVAQIHEPISLQSGTQSHEHMLSHNVIRG